MGIHVSRLAHDSRLWMNSANAPWSYRRPEAQFCFENNHYNVSQREQPLRSASVVRDVLRTADCRRKSHV